VQPSFESLDNFVWSFVVSFVSCVFVCDLFPDDNVLFRRRELPQLSARARSVLPPHSTCETEDGVAKGSP